MTKRSAYSLVEVLVAAGLVAVGIAAAAMLTLTMVSQQTAGARVSRIINYQEQAGRLYQLGLSPATITNNVLPGEPGLFSLSFSENTNVVLANIGTVEVAVTTLLFDAGSMLNSGASATTETNVAVFVRPRTR